MTNSWFNSFLLTFVPLFVVIDTIGNLPVIVSLSEGLTPGQRRQMIHLAALTATAVGLAFLLLGKLVLSLMGISVGAFAIAGGLILLILSIRFMTTGHFIEVIRSDMMAVVPIGTPITVGPATITTLLLLSNNFPLYLVLLAFVLNMLVNWVIFLAGERIARLIGRGGIMAISRVLNLLLAAIGVNMMIQGLRLIGIIEG
ncbi:MAG: MarC family protein [Chloroflexota bacterium]